MITCQISWIDKQGNPTPDNNPAIGVVVCYDPASVGKKGSKPYFCCAEHAKQLDKLPHWRLYTPKQVSEKFDSPPIT